VTPSPASLRLPARTTTLVFPTISVTYLARAPRTGSAQALLLRIVPTSFLAIGAELQWLSAFPCEAEVLYPPLTFLKPTGRTDSVSVDRDGRPVAFTIVEVEPVVA
jgi:hypothetical protein